MADIVPASRKDMAIPVFQHSVLYLKGVLHDITLKNSIWSVATRGESILLISSIPDQVIPAVVFNSMDRKMFFIT